MFSEPLRVIVLSRDRRFLKVAGFLFRRGGAIVATETTRVEATRVVERGETDLIVLDSGDSLGEAAEFVAELREHHPEVLVVAVADGHVSAPQHLELTLWPKWQDLTTMLAMADEARTGRALASAQTT